MSSTTLAHTPKHLIYPSTVHCTAQEYLPDAMAVDEPAHEIEIKVGPLPHLDDISSRARA